jgi:hypothetical protein
MRPVQQKIRKPDKQEKRPEQDKAHPHIRLKPEGRNPRIRHLPDNKVRQRQQGAKPAGRHSDSYELEDVQQCGQGGKEENDQSA